MSKQYSINQLESFNNDISKVITNSASDESKLDRNLVFSLRVNMGKINDSLEIAEEDLEEPSDEYQEFEQERVQLIRDHGGKIQETNFGFQVVNSEEVMNNKDFKDELKELTDKYEDALKEQNDKMQRNAEKRQEKIAEVDWKMIPLSKFPEKISGDELPLSFIEFVYDDDNENSED